jgi:FdhD protein
VPEEVAIAITVNGSTHAVMMATPGNVEELGLGLALNERIVAACSEIERIEVVDTEIGLDCQLWLSEDRGATYTARRRQMTGPVGCGLCGVESLELATPALPKVSSMAAFSAQAIIAGMEAMARAQALGRETRAVHAAAFHGPSGDVTREDVGRHNALDKVAGALALAGTDPASGFLTITSRVSVELIQKAAIMGVGLIAAVSVPTALAIREADAAGVTLVAVARGDEFEIFTHPHRVLGAVAEEPKASHAA